MFERIDTIVLKVTELEKASRWYQEYLGLNEVFKGEGYRVLQVGGGDTPLTLEHRSEGHPIKQNLSYPIFFPTDLEGAYRQLKEKGVEVSTIKSDGTNSYFHFYDPDGNRLEVCHWS
ncbi:VOC family protein [Alteribacillus sp. HJP-4]|uniref:VOC family protein n=1 Tax=Alteribacillus sp. HJP-4 TaxID=2775394 RepID=UPI0035CCE1A0